MNWILKVLVGSRAHGLHTETSDYDYRGVFVEPTEELLKLGGAPKQTHWVEGRDVTQAGNKIDDTAWEVGHFLDLATRCNPTILEVFAAPMELETTEEGESLRDLFPYVWHPGRVRDAFTGYGLNQRKKLLEGKDDRGHKYAVAYLRTLLQADHLLRTGVLLVNFEHHVEYPTLLLFRSKMATVGQIIDKCKMWERQVDAAFETCKQKPDLDRVNDWLLTLRRNHFAGCEIEDRE